MNKKLIIKLISIIVIAVSGSMILKGFQLLSSVISFEQAYLDTLQYQGLVMIITGLLLLIFFICTIILAVNLFGDFVE